MCSMILIALNTFLATPACVAPDGPATVAAQTWSAYELQAEGFGSVSPAYDQTSGTITAGAYSRPTDGPYAQQSGPFLGFTWFADSYTLVLSNSGQ